MSSVQLVAFIVICFVIHSAYAVYPYDPVYYNLIDSTPMCFPMGLCAEYGEWGKSIDSVHPSNEERAIHLLRNAARLFPNEYKLSKYGMNQWGYSGSNTWQWNTNNFCGISTPYPAYWYSMGTQASRFHQWDKLTCAHSISHDTCTDPNRCARFGDSCSFGSRSQTFIPLGGIWGKAEGVWNMNNGYADGHCSAVFDPDYKYFGIGFWPSMSSATALYIKNGPPRDYPIYMASHFDETAKIPASHHHVDGKHLTFVMGWYGDADTINKQSDKAYVLYKDTLTA
eukprot:180557_1